MGLPRKSYRNDLLRFEKKITSEPPSDPSFLRYSVTAHCTGAPYGLLYRGPLLTILRNEQENTPAYCITTKKFSSYLFAPPISDNATTKRNGFMGAERIRNQIRKISGPKERTKKIHGLLLSTMVQSDDKNQRKKLHDKAKRTYVF